MGQMGAGITVYLLTADHPVAAVETDDGTRATARWRALAMLRESERNGLLRCEATQLIRPLEISADYAALGTSMPSLSPTSRMPRSAVESSATLRQ